MSSSDLYFCGSDRMMLCLIFQFLIVLHIHANSSVFIFFLQDLFATTLLRKSPNNMVAAKDVIALVTIDIFSTRTYKLICLLAPRHRSTSPYGILKYIISERLDSH